MGDYAHDQTEKKLAQLEKRISKVYSEAAEDAKKDFDKYFSKFVDEDKTKRAQLDSGEIDKKQYQSWLKDNIATGKRYADLQTKLSSRMLRANETALAYVNNDMAAIYALNRNFGEFELETLFGDLSFTLWDEATVKRLLVDEPDLLPDYPEDLKVDEKADVDYNKKQLARTITSGILQGKSISAISSDLMERLPEINRNSAIRAARTAITNAENAGRQDNYAAAAKMGIEVRKMWMATLDGRTRDSHRRLDGEVVEWSKKFSNGLRYPGDRTGKPEEVYNCRCTIRTVEKPGIRVEPRQRRTEDGKLIKDMNYQEWERWRNGRS